MREHLATYQKMAGRLTKWRCLSHNREANHICLTQAGITVHCAPGQAGILLPCRCEPVEP
jgi:hypothetical protein